MGRRSGKRIQYTEIIFKNCHVLKHIMKKYLILSTLFAMLQANIPASASSISHGTTTLNSLSQQIDIYSDQHIINRAAKLFYCIPDHAQVSPNAKPYMTDELYYTLKEAWDVPHWCYGYIGDEEFLYYFVTGNGGGSIGKNSAISGAIQSKSEKMCQVRINYKEYEQGYGYYQNVESIEILMYLQNGDWVMADFGLGTLDECKKYIKKQVCDYKSGEIARQMKSLGLAQSDFNKARREFDVFLSVYESGSGELATVPYNETTTPPTFKGEGLDGFVNWVLSKVQYPEYCKEEGVQGDVKVRFTIDENGFVIDEFIVKSVEPSLDAEALRIITTSPQWKVGKCNYYDVRTVIELTIPFRVSGAHQASSISQQTIQCQNTSHSQTASQTQTSSSFSASQTSAQVSDEESIPFQLVEYKPSFNGGDSNDFSKWVNEHLVYPEIAKENGIQGRVMVHFTVNSKGEVRNVKVLRGVDSSLDKEAVRVVSQSPLWIPGKHHGQVVSVSYTFPVIFQLR